MLAGLLDDVTSAWIRRRMQARLPYPAGSTALILVDVQNDFFHPDGPGMHLIRDVAKSIAYRSNIRRIVDRSRHAGVSVIHCPFRLDDATPEVRDTLPYIRRLRRHEIATTARGAAVPDELHEPRDIVLSPHDTLNVFYGTDLEQLLDKRGIQHLLVAGSVANAGVDSTGRMGVELDYDVTFVRDCIAAFAPQTHQNCTEVTFPRLAPRVWSHRQVLEHLEPDPGFGDDVSG